MLPGFVGCWPEFILGVRSPAEWLRKLSVQFKIILWRPECLHGERHMNSRASRIFLGLLLATMPLLSVACGSSMLGGGGGGQTGNVNLMVSDASTEDWATIGVKILSISLIPQGGGTPVNVFTAPSPVPTTNLVQLDQLSELLGTLSAPAGTYTGAILTIGANAGDVTLIVAADPETGFAGTPGATIPSSQIQIQGKSGSSGSFTVPVTVNFT